MAKTLLVTFLLVVLIPLRVSAQETEEKTLFVQAPVLLDGLLQIPTHVNADSPIPLVIGLHGGGSNPEAFRDVWSNVPEADFLYLALRAPYPIPNAPEPSYDWAFWTSADTTAMLRAARLLPAYVGAAIKAVALDYDVGPVYLAGFSQGAIYAYVVAMQTPDLFDGLLVFGGPGLLAPLSSPFIPEPVLPDWVSEKQIEAASTLRVFMAHGQSDTAVAFELAERSHEILKQHNYDVTFRSFDGGHQLPPDEILQEAALWIRRTQ